MKPGVLPPLPDLDRCDTLPKLLAHNAERFGSAVALREKRLGLWTEFTWAQYRDGVEKRAYGLAALGVARGDVVGLIGDNRPDWVMGEIAAHALGAMSLGIYRDALDEEVAYLVGHAGVQVILAEDEEQVDKLLALGDRIPTVRHIVYADPRGMRKYDDPRLLAESDLFERAEQARAADPDFYGQLGRRRLRPRTSRSSARPPAPRRTRSWRCCRRRPHPPLRDLPRGSIPRGRTTNTSRCCRCPGSWSRSTRSVKPLLCRMRVNFVEEPETMMADMREIGPTFMLLAPRVWEQIAADVRARMMDASPLKRLLFERRA